MTVEHLLLGRGEEPVRPIERGEQASMPVIGVPGYWHESEAILGRQATAVPDSYIRALLKIEAIPLIIPVLPSSQMLAQFFNMMDGLLLVGGPGTGKIDAACRWI